MRRVENETEVMGVLERYGFRMVEPASLSFSEQVRVFSECRTLVSVHGAGITNCIFMPRSAHVLELYRTIDCADPWMNPCYWKLCEAAGLRYYYQFCAHGRNDGDTIDHVNIIVDTAKLERNIQLMLGDAA